MIGLTRLEVVPTMHDRKARLTELADGFIVLPGGFGTVDEFAEALTWNQLGLDRQAGRVARRRRLLGAAVRMDVQLGAAGFVRDSHRMLAQRAHTIDEAIALATGPGARRRPQVDRSRRHAAARRTSFTVQLITSAALKHHRGRHLARRLRPARSSAARSVSCM